MIRAMLAAVIVLAAGCSDDSKSNPKETGPGPKEAGQPKEISIQKDRPEARELTVAREVGIKEQGSCPAVKPSTYSPCATSVSTNCDFFLRKSDCGYLDIYLHCACTSTGCSCCRQDLEDCPRDGGSVH